MQKLAMPKYLLDTNMVTHILRENPNVLAKVSQLSVADIGISSLTLAEISYGFAKTEKVKMQRLFKALLLRLTVLPFDEKIAHHYGMFRVNIEKQGKSLAPLDLLIASHADAVQAVLVSNDKAFYQIPNLRVEDWTL